MLLFGSRARGDHLPSSDWDIAAVTGEPRNRPRDLPLLDLREADTGGIDVVFISEGEIRRGRNRAGRLGSALAREARPIAGSWRPPDGLEKLDADIEAYQEEINNALRRFREALATAEEALLYTSADRARGAAGGFVSRTSDAAENLAKALLICNGVAPRRIHDLGALAGDIAATKPELAADLRSLNDRTAADHTRHYSDTPLTSFRRPGSRQRPVTPAMNSGTAPRWCAVRTAAGGPASTGSGLAVRMSSGRSKNIPAA